MKITCFSPLIVTSDPEKAIRLFEDLGFQKCHRQDPSERITNVTMRDADGRQVDIAGANVEKDLSLIRMNVDDFDEAVEFLTARGFTNRSGRVLETESSRSAMMVSPSGFAFDLAWHKK